MPSIRLADLAQQLDAELHGDGDIVITAVASMQSAKAGTITFMVSPKYREHGSVRASAVVLTQDDLPFATNAALVVKNPYLTYARMAQILIPRRSRRRTLQPALRLIQRLSWVTTWQSAQTPLSNPALCWVITW